MTATNTDVRPLADLVRTVADWPKPGILFYDITTLLADASGFHRLVDEMSEHWAGQRIDAVVGIEARGFILAPALAYHLGAGFIPMRKPAKLPGATVSIEYALEYGNDELQVHTGAIVPGSRVLICDDLLATGGTAAAALELCTQVGAEVVGAAFAIELSFLNGRGRLDGLLGGLPVQSVITYNE
jgi:adenine phosphoribosyltransferase